MVQSPNGRLIEAPKDITTYLVLDVGASVFVLAFIALCIVAYQLGKYIDRRWPEREYDQ